MSLCVETLEDHTKWRKHFKRLCLKTGFDKKFEKIAPIGKGGFAEVFVVKNKRSKLHFAAKVFDLEKVRKSDKIFVNPRFLSLLTSPRTA